MEHLPTAVCASNPVRIPTRRPAMLSTMHIAEDRHVTEHHGAQQFLDANTRTTSQEILLLTTANTLNTNCSVQFTLKRNK
jgi:hypothetical protein